MHAIDLTWITLDGLAIALTLCTGVTLALSRWGAIMSPAPTSNDVTTDGRRGHVEAWLTAALFFTLLLIVGLSSELLWLKDSLGAPMAASLGQLMVQSSTMACIMAMATWAGRRGVTEQPASLGWFITATVYILCVAVVPLSAPWWLGQATLVRMLLQFVFPAVLTLTCACVVMEMGLTGPVAVASVTLGAALLATLLAQTAITVLRDLPPSPSPPRSA